MMLSKQVQKAIRKNIEVIISYNFNVSKNNNDEVY
jgi:hypothetical protein